MPAFQVSTGRTVPGVTPESAYGGAPRRFAMRHLLPEGVKALPFGVP